MNQNRSRSNYIKISIFIIIVFIIVFGKSSYAKYRTTTNGSGTATVAKWSVKINEKNMNNITNTFDLKFTANNNDTVPNKIAPGGTAVAYVNVDLTGTEVSVKFDCKLADNEEEKLVEAFGSDYASKIEVSIGTPELQDNTENMTLNLASKTITIGNGPMKGIVQIPIKLTWKNDLTNNVEDTNTGRQKIGAEIPITLIVQQHI